MRPETATCRRPPATSTRTLMRVRPDGLVTAWFCTAKPSPAPDSSEKRRCSVVTNGAAPAVDPGRTLTVVIP